MTTQKQFDHNKARQLLKEQGRKQVWLANELRLSPAYLTLILNGSREPGAGTVKLMSIILGVSEDVLFIAA
jgi:transcriptional regulator with XRE-family HTH domain